MSQTILIDNDPSSSYLFNYLSTYLRTNIIRLNTAEEAIELLEFIPLIPLIIVRAGQQNDWNARKIYQHLKDKDHQTEMIVLGVDLDLLGLVNCMEEPINWSRLLTEASQVLNRDQLSEGPEFVAISVSHFMEVKTVPCEVFLRIRKGGENYQFIKLLNVYEEVDHHRLNRFVERDLKFLYVEKGNAQQFIISVANELMKKLETEMSVEERILTTARSHSFIKDVLGKSEYDNSHFDLSEMSIESMQGSVRNSPQITKLIRFLTSNKVSAYYKHAHLRALMCHYVLSKQSWYRSHHLHVLSFTSFYHGMLLKKEEHILLQSEDDVRFSKLSSQEKRDVLEQPKALVDILSSHPGLTDYIRTVLVQSQGSMEGVGLVEAPCEELHPLSKVFIVADQFVKILLDPQMPSTKKDILPILSERLKNPSYQKILRSLEQKFD